MYHRIQSPLVERNINGLVGKTIHVPHIHILPLYAWDVLMALSHGLDNHIGEIDALLLLVAKRRKVGGNRLGGPAVSDEMRRRLWVRHAHCLQTRDAE